jgi:hypothetical protein
VAIAGQTPPAQDGLLLSSAFVTLPRGPSVQPTLGVLTLFLRTAAAMPGPLEIHLLVADLEVGRGVQP